MRRAWVALIPLIVALGLTLTMPSSGQAADTNPVPYGGCREGGVAPHSEGARWCRNHGWIITRMVTISPHGAAVTGFKPCREEDSRRCYWNALKRGNGYGHGFISLPGRTVWVDMINHRWATTKKLREHAWVAWPFFG